MLTKSSRIGVSRNILVTTLITIMLVALIGTYFVIASHTTNGHSTSTTSSSTSTTSSSSNLTCTYTTSYQGYQSICPAPLSDYALSQLVEQPNTTFENYHNGTMIVYYGHNACIINFYVLSNETLVVDYVGVTGTQTCE